MKKIVFITLYDMICYGLRILSSVAKENGIDSHIILFKGEKSYVPIWKNKDKYETYQYYYNGLLRGSHYAVDPYTEREVDLLIDTLGGISPDVICLSTRSFAYQICKDIFPKIKAAFPGVPIVSGGWGPSLEPEKFLEFSDYACFGEGEITIKDLCDHIEVGRDLNEVPNLIYYNNGRLFRNEVSQPLEESDLNKLPFPDFDIENKYLIDNGKLHLGKDFYNEKVYDCFAARGCPLNCTYCMSSKYRQIYKDYAKKTCGKYRLRNIDVVFKEITEAKKLGAEFIRFKDEVFPINPGWIKAFMERYKSEIGLPFFGFVRPEFHNAETIRALHDAGLCVTMVGVQSGSEEILKNIYKRMLAKDKIIEFANTLSHLGIQYSYHFIYRNPFEKENNLKESLEFTYMLPFANAFIYKLQPFQGSPLKKMIDEEKPTPLPKNVYDWYAILHSMSLKGRFYRNIARFIQKNKIVMRLPGILSLIFIVPLLKEYVAVLKNKYFYKAALHFSPKTK